MELGEVCEKGGDGMMLECMHRRGTSVIGDTLNHCLFLSSKIDRAEEVEANTGPAGEVSGVGKVREGMS